MVRRFILICKTKKGVIMKTTKLIFIIILAFCSLHTHAAEYVKRENGIILIGSDDAVFRPLLFNYKVNLELYTDGVNKQYIMKLSIPIKSLHSFRNDSKVVFNLLDNTRVELSPLYHFYDELNSYAYIPITEKNIAKIVSGIKSIEIDIIRCYIDGIIKDELIVQEFKKSGWEREPGIGWKNYNFIKHLQDSYDEVNKEYDKLKKKNFEIKIK